MVKTARINLGYARIESPISARIGKSTVTDGAIVTAYQPRRRRRSSSWTPSTSTCPAPPPNCCGLQQRRERLRGDEAGLDQVQLVLEDGTPYAHEGTLQFRDVSVDRPPARRAARMVFPNPDGVAAAGMFVRAILKEGVDEQALLGPAAGGDARPQGQSAGIDRQRGRHGRAAAARAWIAPSAIQWLVASGLQAGDKVVVEGGQNLRPGAAVREVPFQAPEAGPAAAPRRLRTETSHVVQILPGTARFRLGDRIVIMAAGALAIYHPAHLPISGDGPAVHRHRGVVSRRIGRDGGKQRDPAHRTENDGLDGCCTWSASSDSAGGAPRVTFAPGTDVDVAWSQVQNKLQSALPSLPDVVKNQASKSSNPPTTTCSWWA
jgi:hypothetical protein